MYVFVVAVWVDLHKYFYLYLVLCKYLSKSTIQLLSPASWVIPWSSDLQPPPPFAYTIFLSQELKNDSQPQCCPISVVVCLSFSSLSFFLVLTQSMLAKCPTPFGYVFSFIIPNKIFCIKLMYHHVNCIAFYFFHSFGYHIDLVYITNTGMLHILFMVLYYIYM